MAMRDTYRAMVGVGALLLATSVSLHAQTVAGAFAADYTATSLGSVPSLPTRYGGLTFLDDDTLLIGGAANGSTGSLYTVDVARDSSTNHIVGFIGSATRYGTDIGEYNDGGVTFGPGGVLFTSRWPINSLGQTKPGSTNEDKIIDLAALGVANSHAAINFVPSGFGGAGQVKLVSWSGGQWYSGTLTPDGSGTYDITGLAQVDLNPATAAIDSLPGGPEGFVYIRAGNPGFSVDSLLVSDYSASLVSAYELDAQGNPLISTRRTFITGLTGAEGAAIDPITGDFLFSTFGGSNQVVVVSGFNTPPVPEPATWALWLVGAAGLVGWRRRSR